MRVHRIFVRHEAACAEIVALRTVGSVQLCFRIGDKLDSAGMIAHIGKRHAPNLPSALAWDEDAHRAFDSVI